MYVNNLVSSYLKVGQYQEARNLSESYRKLYEESQNSYRRITFMSNDLRTLVGLQLYKKAENMGLFFYNKYEDEILQYRWNHFFSSYVDVLLKTENYSDILKIEKKLQLTTKEKERYKNETHVPVISLGVALASYMENLISKDQLILQIHQLTEKVKVDNSNRLFYEKITESLSKSLPELHKIFKSY